MQFVAVNILVIFDHSGLPPHELISALLSSKHFNGTINNQTLLKDFAPDKSPALRALFLTNEALSDTLMAVAVTTHSNSTAYNGVHANRTLQRRKLVLVLRGRSCFVLQLRAVRAPLAFLIC